MTQRVYRSANGKVVDLGALQLKNENVRAVGNMPVNARGDLLDSQNRPIESKNQQVVRQYQKQVTNVSDDVVVSKKSARPQQPQQPQPQQQQPAQVSEQVAENVEATDDSDQATGGLAAAIARARKIKQEPLKTPQQMAKDSTGLTKI